MPRERKEDGFNLAFLDVMSCGLGAVILILVIVKFSESSDIPAEEIEKLKEELAAMEQERDEVEQQLEVEQERTAARTQLIEDTERDVEQLEVQLEGAAKALQKQQAVVADLENAVAAQAPLVADDPIATEGTGEEVYVTGLAVEGARIGILIDQSASMTEESVADILQRKLGSESDKKQGSKWQRTLRTAKWLLARLPQQATVSVAAFNDTTRVLGGRNTIQASDVSGLKAIQADLDKLAPMNGTNLQAGLEAIAGALPRMTNLYLVTDGLPSLVNRNSGFSTSRNCKPLPGAQSLITGECRAQVFEHTRRNNAASQATVNVILFPLEGDPEAPSRYWIWASRSGGTFISPAASWP